MLPSKGKKLLSAVASPLTLAVSAAGAATFVISGLWWVVPLTLGVAGVVSATQYRGEAPARQLPPAYARREASLFSAIDRIAKALASSGPTIRGSLATVPAQLDDMRASISRLLDRQVRIDTFRKEASPETVAVDLQQFQKAEAAALSADARQKFASAAKNKQAQMVALSELAASAERITAELAEMDAALASTLSKIVALEDQHGEAARLSSEGIAGSLDEVLTTVTALEQALTETFDPDGQRPRR